MRYIFIGVDYFLYIVPRMSELSSAMLFLFIGDRCSEPVGSSLRPSRSKALR